MYVGIDPEELKKHNREYALQVAALTEFCKMVPKGNFRCDPSKMFVIKAERIYTGRDYILDEVLKKMEVRPLMLTRAQLMVPTPVGETEYTHAIFCRLATEEEREEYLKAKGWPEFPESVHSLNCLESMGLASATDRYTSFHPTGQKVFYTD